MENFDAAAKIPPHLSGISRNRIFASENHPQFLHSWFVLLSVGLLAAVSNPLEAASNALDKTLVEEAAVGGRAYKRPIIEGTVST